MDNPSHLSILPDEPDDVVRVVDRRSDESAGLPNGSCRSPARRPHAPAAERHGPCRD